MCVWPASLKLQLNPPKQVTVLRLTQHVFMHTHTHTLIFADKNHNGPKTARKTSRMATGWYSLNQIQCHSPEDHY